MVKASFWPTGFGPMDQPERDERGTFGEVPSLLLFTTKSSPQLISIATYRISCTILNKLNFIERFKNRLALFVMTCLLQRKFNKKIYKCDQGFSIILSFPYPVTKRRFVNFV